MGLWYSSSIRHSQCRDAGAIPAKSTCDYMLEKRVDFYNTKRQRIVGLLSLPKNRKPPIAIIIHGFKARKPVPWC